MRKILALMLTVASFGLVTAAEAKTSGSTISSATGIASSSPMAAQFQRGRRGWGRGRARVATQTRLVRAGRHVYRETYQVRYLPNGRTQTRLISRVQVR